MKMITILLACFLDTENYIATMANGETVKADCRGQYVDKTSQKTIGKWSMAVSISPVDGLKELQIEDNHYSVEIKGLSPENNIDVLVLREATKRSLEQDFKASLHRATFDPESPKRITI